MGRNGDRHALGATRQIRPECAAIRTGTFDVKTGALGLEGEARGPDGAVVAYVIEGTIDHDTVAGTFTFGGGERRFAFKKQ